MAANANMMRNRIVPSSTFTALPQPWQSPGLSILVGKHPLAGDHLRLNIVIGIDRLIAGGAVANLQIEDIFRGFIDEIIGIALACRKANAHAR